MRVVLRRVLMLVAAGVVVVIAVEGLVSDSVPLGPVSVSQDGLSLELPLPTCNADVRTEVSHDDKAVVVTVYATNAEEGLECQDVAVVRLSRPLGQRAVFDGHGLWRRRLPLERAQARD